MAEPVRTTTTPHRGAERMARYARGLVIGKFYPPHRGHTYLIDVARAHCDHLTIVVCDAAGQSIPGALRAAWLRELHPDAEVLRIDDVYPPDDSRVWAEQTIGWLGSAPGAVFTSENYGDAYARFMGCVHVQVDRARRAVPCSGTVVRQRPLALWDYLDPPVRAYFCARVCVVGAESSGTTTLARALAAHYGTGWVPEYGRDYWEEKMARAGLDGSGSPEASAAWRTEEFVHIAREQARREDEAARAADRVLIADTDPFATEIWHDRSLGSRSPVVAAVAAARPRPPDLYIVTDVDIPFVQDGTRDGEHARSWMHGRFLEELRARALPHIVVSGPREERLRAAAAAIDARVLAPRGYVRV